jgi:hypothetical protein
MPPRRDVRRELAQYRCELARADLDGLKHGNAARDGGLLHRRLTKLLSASRRTIGLRDDGYEPMRAGGDSLERWYGELRRAHEHDAQSADGAGVR